MISTIEEVRVSPQPLDRFSGLIRDEQFAQLRDVARTSASRMEGRVWWNINSTASGGGVAEMLATLMTYARGAGIDTRWLVIEGSPEFFRVTKRLHHAMHGDRGDGSPLGCDERAMYEEVMSQNEPDLLSLIESGDVVVLHDPQTAGLAAALARAGALVIWRCHIGADVENAETALAWSFLLPYLTKVSAAVFSRSAYAPPEFDPDKVAVIPPSIDPFSPKNQEFDQATTRAILVHAGLVEDACGDGQPVYTRMDGSPGRVSRRADIVRNGPAPDWATPLVVQVSRWDPLKDPIGVMRGFAQPDSLPPDVALMLAGPNVTAVTDDPEGLATFEEVVDVWQRLPDAYRSRIHLASLPMDDIEENAAMVNALQRHAAVVAQKSINEGFGLTVAEAMWKGRPVIASRVGGIQDQIDHGVDGLLLDDPTNLTAFNSALSSLFAAPDLAERLGSNAHKRIRDEFLAVRQLTQWAELLERLDVPTSV